MAYHEFPPSERLDPYIECFWVRRPSIRNGLHRVLPDGCIDLLVEFPPLQDVPCLSMVGTMTRALIVQPEMLSGLFLGVRFQPGAAPLFFNFPWPDLVDARIPFQDLEPARSSQLSLQLAEAQTIEARITLLEQFLLSSLRKDCRVPVPIRALLRAHSTAPATASISVLSRDLGISRQYLARLCKSWSGTGPKQLSRILRFRRIVDRIQAAPEDVRWVELALDHGYFDQAHLVRDFHQLSGLAPGQYRREVLRRRG